VGPHVPVYLRFEGKVRNLRVSKATILCLIHEIWIQKAIHEGRPIDAAFLNLTGQTKAIPSGATESSDFELFKEHDRNSIVEVLKKNLIRLSVDKDPLDAMSVEADASLNADADHKADSARATALEITPPIHYVRLLPSLPPNATLAEFFNCYLRVSNLRCYCHSIFLSAISRSPSCCHLCSNHCMWLLYRHHRTRQGMISLPSRSPTTLWRPPRSTPP